MGAPKVYFQEKFACLNSLVFLLVLIFVARTVYLLHSVRKTRQMKDPRTITRHFSPSAPFANTTAKPLKTLIVLGSGGHTTEMLDLMKNLNLDRYRPIVFVIATTDTTSLQRVQAYQRPIPLHDKNDVVGNRSNTYITSSEQVYRIPRSREVGQSYLSSIFTTFYSFIFAFWLVGFQVKPDLVLVNGPGTCLPIAVSAFFFRIVGMKPSAKIIFIESFCRVTSLSLTGKLLYPIADLFAVCWEKLHEKYPLTYLVTSFIPRKEVKQN